MIWLLYGFAAVAGLCLGVLVWVLRDLGRTLERFEEFE